MEALLFLNKSPLFDPHQITMLYKKVSLPANEIITKQYTADIKPVMKLITKQELQKSTKNINYIPPKIKNQQYEKYGQNFRTSDFLGNYYADYFDQMIYFKYNNNSYNEIIDEASKRNTKFMAGLFIPLKMLSSKSFKNYDNIYNPLNIQAPQIKQSIIQSFAKNSKGCSFDPLFTSNFTSGNLMAVIRNKPFEYDLILQNDINCKAAEWFNFAVKFIQEGTYTFNIINLSNQLPFYQMGMKIPHYSFYEQSFKSDTEQTLKTGHGWSFGGRKISFKKSNLRKENQMFDQTYYCLSFEFKCKNRQQIVMFSSAIPYTCLDYEKFLNRVLYNKIGQHMKMEAIDICETLGGNKLKAYFFYHRKSKSNTMILKSFSQETSQGYRSMEKSKTMNLNSSMSSSGSSIINSLQPLNDSSSSANIKTIVFLARQHSGSTASSFLIEGIIEFLMDNTEFDICKKNFNFIIVPFVNADGVKYGNQRTNLSGSDLNKIWRNPNQIFEPEVFHLKNFLKTINQSNPISLLIDLKSNSHSLLSYFKAQPAKKETYENPQIFPYICSKRMNQISFQNSEFFSSNNKTCGDVLSELFPKSLVYTFNVSSYGWKNEPGFRRYTNNQFQDENAIHQFTPDIYRNIGKQLITTYLQYIRLCDKNIGIKDRWIKQIESLGENLKSRVVEDVNLQEKKYEETWDRQLLRFDYSLFMESKQLPQIKKNVQRRNKTLLLRGSTNLFELRSNSKKKTVPIFRSHDSTIENNSIDIKRQLIQNELTKSIDSTLDQFKKTPLQSSIFSPKRRSQILKQISQSIKDNKKDSSINPFINMKRKSQNDKRLSNKYKQNKTQLKDAIVRFQGMKKFMTTMGIKSQTNKS